MESKPQVTDVKEVLVKAKSLIEDETKWTKGTYRGSDGCMCAMGAVYRAMTVRPYEFFPHRVRAELAKHIRAGGVEWFNDHSKTTHQDVMNLFDQAIESISP